MSGAEIKSADNNDSLLVFTLMVTTVVSTYIYVCTAHISNVSAHFACHACHTSVYIFSCLLTIRSKLTSYVYYSHVYIHSCLFCSLRV